MRIRPGKLVVGVCAIALCVAYLGYAGARGGWVYYVDVDTCLNERIGQRVRVHGVVRDGSVEMDRVGLWARFEMSGQGAAMPVWYQGVIPDMFESGREVIVEGSRGADGVFRADVLLTKCASKYQGRAETSP